MKVCGSGSAEFGLSHCAYSYLGSFVLCLLVIWVCLLLQISLAKPFLAPSLQDPSSSNIAVPCWLDAGMQDRKKGHISFQLNFSSSSDPKQKPLRHKTGQRGSNNFSRSVGQWAWHFASLELNKSLPFAISKFTIRLRISARPAQNAEKVFLQNWPP